MIQLKEAWVGNVVNTLQSLDPAKVAQVHALTGDNFVYDLQYNDGDFERHVQLERVRCSSDSSAGASATRGAAAGTGEQDDEVREEGVFLLREPSIAEEAEAWVGWFEGVKRSAATLANHRAVGPNAEMNF